MSSFLHPHGRQPASVYWRRRAVVFGIVLVVFLVVVLLAVKPGAGTSATPPATSASPAATSAATGSAAAPHVSAAPAAGGSGAAAASASAAPAASAKAAPGAASGSAAGSSGSAAGASGSAGAASAAGAACAAAQISLKPIADKNSYSSLELPKISMSITNTATTACTIDLGSAQQVLTISSGAETYWTSKDCQVGGTHQKITLTAGQTLKTPSISWDRTRSSTKTCSTSRSAVPAGGASYHLRVSVGSIPSSTSALMILN